MSKADPFVDLRTDATRSLCPHCGKMTLLDARICGMCGRLLTWRVTRRAEIAADRARRGLLSWVNGSLWLNEKRVDKGHDGYHLNWAEMENKR